MPSDRTTHPDDTELLVHAHLDGELNAADAVAVRKKIETDPALSGQLETYQALQDTLRARFPREEFPPHLRMRLDAVIDREDAAIRREKEHARPTWTALAASVAAAIIVSSITTWLMLRFDPTGSGVPTRAAGEQTAFPGEFGVHYATVAGGQVDLVRDLYANQTALDAVRSGNPLPYGSVLIRNVYDVERDAAGVPVKDAKGNLTRSKLLFTAVMEKQAGWHEFPAGEWKYRSFAPDKTPMTESVTRCFECHNKVRDQDFVFSLDRMRVARH